MRTERWRFPHPFSSPPQKKPWICRTEKKRKNVIWRKRFIGSWDKARPPGSGPFWTSLATLWAGEVSCRQAVPGGHWVALVVKTCTSLGSPPPTPPHILCKFQLPKVEITCSLRVSAGSVLLEEFDAMGLFIRGRVNWDLRSDSVPSLALGQSLRPWCVRTASTTPAKIMTPVAAASIL